jgi:potassium/hydrogen antiporter
MDVFILISVLVFAGFLGNVFFNKTKFSDLIILMLLGLLAGPVFHILSADVILSFRELSPFIGAIALIILLFEGGIHLNFHNVIKELPKSTFFTLFNFFLTCIAVSIILSFFGWDYIHGFLVGAILGGISSAVVVPLVSVSRATENTKTFLTLESAITDSLCVITVIALIHFILSAGDIGVQGVLQNLFAAFSIATVLGAIIAIFWLTILRDFKLIVQPAENLLTIAILFSLYSLTEFVGGNGAFAVLIFALVLGNSKVLMNFLKMREIELDSEIRSFQSEIAFFVKSFFFVYLGIIFDSNSFNLELLGIATVLLLGIILPRLISVTFLTKFSSKYLQDSFLMKSMMARGLAAAVLATLPLAMGLQGEFIVMIPQIVFLSILLTNILTSVGFYLNEQKEPIIIIQDEKIEEIDLTKEKNKLEKKEISESKKIKEKINKKQSKEKLEFVEKKENTETID